MTTCVVSETAASNAGFGLVVRVFEKSARSRPLAAATQPAGHYALLECEDDFLSR